MICTLLIKVMICFCLLVLQAELLQSRAEVKSLLDKISELTREKAENVSHVVHTQLLQIADDKALQAESKCRQLENEVQKSLP